MPDRRLDEEAIFRIARKLGDPDDRSAYLHQVCAGDARLRERVQSLLGVHDREEAFLKSNGDPGSTAALSVVREAPGQQIGRYKLLQQIGEGGFGVVYMAEQQRPVHRKVALKIIKPGMDTRAVVARFEAERQALALMDHPNIARVFDGGATENGRPYFVMELVKGVPITEYCDSNQLPAEERLRLFVAVCQAVQHAHQKGIIHRDLKPSNILVTLADGLAVVKVFDFGVAKAIHQQLTEKTLFTAFGQMMGTPQYMSPEQAEMSCLDVDTRSDIYSLGVLLYELLTGTTPLAAERLRTAGYAEMQRIIREEEPPKPSTRLSGSGERLTVIAQHRSATPERLHRLIRGDLDWIVMKALEKERSRRYDTATSLAAEIERFLGSEPVEARPPSRIYRLAKFVRRNRGLMAATTIVLIALVLAVVCTSVALVVAEKQRTAATDALEKAKIILFDKALWYALAGDIEHTRDSMFQAQDLRFPDWWTSFAEGVAYTWAGDRGQEARECFDRIPSDIDDAFAVRAAASLVARTDRDLAEMRNELHSQRPQTPLDYLFQVQVESWLRPENGLLARETCDEWKDSTIAKYFGALASVNRALERHDLHTAQTAVNALDDLSGWYPNNPVPQCAQLYAILVAQNIRRSDNDTSSSHLYDTKAQELVAILEEPSHRIFWVARTRACYFAERGDGVQALQEWEKRVNREPFGIDAMIYAACVVLFGDSVDVATAVKRLPTDFGADNGHAQLAKAYLLAASGAPIESVQAMCDQLVVLDDSPEMQCGCVEACLVAGSLPAARQRATVALSKLGAGEDHWRTANECIAKDLPDNELQRRFEAPMFQGMPDYYVGLRCLAKGEHDRARQAFQNCCHSGRFLATWYWWAKVFRARLNTSSS